MAAANAHFAWGHYADADHFYTILQKDYPRSEHQFNAHLLGFRTKLLRYQGPEYGNKPLDEAEELATQLLTQFPTELGAERQKIIDAQGQIAANKALREFKLGEYYSKNKYYAASRIYYAKVVNKWPDTALAQQAKTRIEDDKDKPGAPPKMFAWVDKILPPENTGALGGGGATSGIPTGMGSAMPGIGTLGGMGSGSSAAVPSGNTTK
jgi:outer membrane protein assembly factor BamD (BamD/ComL family)